MMQLLRIPTSLGGPRDTSLTETLLVFRCGNASLGIPGPFLVAQPLSSFYGAISGLALVRSVPCLSLTLKHHVRLCLSVLSGFLHHILTSSCLDSSTDGGGGHSLQEAQPCAHYAIIRHQAAFCLLLSPNLSYGLVSMYLKSASDPNTLCLQSGLFTVAPPTLLLGAWPLYTFFQ